MDKNNSEEYERAAREDLRKTFNADYETSEETEHALHGWMQRFPNLPAPVGARLLKDEVEEAERRQRDIDAQMEFAEILESLLSRTAGLSIEDIYPQAVATWGERHPREGVPLGPGDHVRIEEA